MRRPTNPLALAVLALLWERPMHPYEMSTTLRERRKEESIRLNYGSLYAVVDSLAKKDHIEVAEVVQHGRRPARTIYRITPTGEVLLMDWMSDLLAVPTPQYTDFEAALSLLATVPVEDALELLRRRLRELRIADSEDEAIRAAAPPTFPRLFLIEAEYTAALRRAEIAFVDGLVDEIADGTLGGVAMWRSMHEWRSAGRTPEEIRRLAADEFGEEVDWTT